ncbi:MAG: hypothetical protein R3217_04600, partial [Gammaproteobacteria bacterium]|nr:hypothetical protein [Gammaproteobacteria bacterium]
MDAIPDLELEQIPAWLFATLADGAARRQAAMHVLTLATIENAEPRQRTMVLRGASAAEGWLQFHTDRRKSLLDALEHGASLSWYSRGLKLQWRARVRLQDMTGTVVEDTAWARTRDLSRRCYRQSLPPGTPVEKAGESGPPVGEGR